MLRTIHITASDVVNRHDIQQEATYLQVIISQLRDQSELRRIFGIVVDKKLLTNVFGGMLFLLYSICKSILDPILLEYMPPSPVRMALGGGQSAGQDILDDTGSGFADGVW
eukprot:SAG22_NODE_709_length_7742_cov_2.383488_2_plen_111_part_00